jgi:hypothetical protein
MFCEKEEEFAMINYLCGIHPDAEEHMIDLMVWCYVYRNAEFQKLLIKYVDYQGLEEEMIAFSDIDYSKLKEIEI